MLPFKKGIYTKKKNSGSKIELEEVQEKTQTKHIDGTRTTDYGIGCVSSSVVRKF